MSEQLPDVYVKIYTTGDGLPYGDVTLQREEHWQARYTPHSKLQEAEDVIDELVLLRTECIDCECEFHNDYVWHESNHKTYCTLAPYMRKRSTTNE